MVIHISIIILRHILYLVYWCPCLSLGQFMTCLYDLYFIFSLFHYHYLYDVIKTDPVLVFCIFFRMSSRCLLECLLDGNVDEESE